MPGAARRAILGGTAMLVGSHGVRGGENSGRRMRGSGGAAPRKKVALFIPRNENFVKYFVLNVNKMPSITVE